MTVGTPENLKRNIMSKLYNLGCSFAYGNCVPRRNQLGDEHRRPALILLSILTCMKKILLVMATA